jgi:hypothetical protein
MNAKDFQGLIDWEKVPKERITDGRAEMDVNRIYRKKFKLGSAIASPAIYIEPTLASCVC